MGLRGGLQVLTRPVPAAFECDWFLLADVAGLRTLAGPRRFAGAHPDAYAVFGAEGRAAEEARRRYPFGLGAQ